MLVIVVVAGVLLQVVNQFVSAYGTQVQVDAGQRMVYDLRAKLFEHLQALGLHHHITTNTGDAVYRIDVDAYAIENLVMSGLFPLATAVITLVVMFVVLLTRDVTVALLSLTTVPFLYLCLRYYMRTLVNRSERVKELESKLLQQSVRSVLGDSPRQELRARTVRGRSATRAFGNEVMNGAHRASRGRSRSSRSSSARSPILGTALVLIVGGNHVMHGQMTVGELTVVIAYLGAVYGPLSSIAHTTGQLQGAIAGARRVRAMLAMVPETVEPRRRRRGRRRCAGDIRFEHVGFAYPDGTRVLHDISFSATPGEMVALVGLTGAGKTTLVSLIPRFYDATKGRMLVDGVDVRRYRVRSLREQDRDRAAGPGAVLGLHCRQPPLRPARRDRRGSRRGRARRARPRVHLAAAPAVPHAGRRGRRRIVGRRTPAAERGPRDSQERADPDPRRADLVARRDLRGDRLLPRCGACAPGRTTIVIAHRLSTVRDADRILVLDGGHIAAQGTHEELLKSSRLYRRMCARLSVGKSLDEPETVDELIQAAKT